MVMDINLANMKNIFATASVEQNKVIEEVVEDGVLTQEELAQLKAVGLDTDVVTANFNIEDAEKVDGDAAPETAATVAQAAPKANVPAEFANDGQIQGWQKEIEKNNAKIANNKNAIAANNKQIDNIKAEMEKLQEEVQKEIEEAIKESEEIAEEQKQKASEAVSGRIAEFTQANGKISYEEFKSGIASDLDGIAGTADSELSAVIGKMIDANDKLGSLDGMLKNIAFLLDENESLTAENTGLMTSNAELNSNISSRVSQLQQEAEERRRCEEEAKKRCDPIGFEAGGKKYDFFLDADGNGDLSNAQEFLGAEDGWAAMAALDLDGDGKVSGEEMDAAGLKMVVTGEDGSQQVINASELFNEENEAIDLSSYNEVNQDVNADVRLLGNFNVNLNDFGGDTIEGYNTLDSLEYLNANYKFTDTDMPAADAEKIAISEDDKYKAYTKEDINFEDMEKSLDELHEKWDEAWTKIGMKPEEMKEVNAAVEAAGKDKAQSLDKKFKEAAEKAEAAEEAKKAEEEQDTQAPAKDYDNLSEEEIAGLTQDEINGLTDEQLAKYGLKKTPATEA